MNIFAKTYPQVLALALELAAACADTMHTSLAQPLLEAVAPELDGYSGQFSDAAFIRRRLRGVLGDDWRAAPGYAGWLAVLEQYGTPRRSSTEWRAL
jgi:hypothetical protein